MQLHQRKIERAKKPAALEINCESLCMLMTLTRRVMRFSDWRFCISWRVAKKERLGGSQWHHFAAPKLIKAGTSFSLLENRNYRSKERKMSPAIWKRCSTSSSSFQAIKVPPNSSNPGEKRNTLEMLLSPISDFNCPPPTSLLPQVQKMSTTDGGERTNIKERWSEELFRSRKDNFVFQCWGCWFSCICSCQSIHFIGSILLYSFSFFLPGETERESRPMQWIPCWFFLRPFNGWPVQHWERGKKIPSRNVVLWGHKLSAQIDRECVSEWVSEHGRSIQWWSAMDSSC